MLHSIYVQKTKTVGCCGGGGGRHGGLNFLHPLTFSPGSHLLVLFLLQILRNVAKIFLYFSPVSVTLGTDPTSRRLSPRPLYAPFTPRLPPPAPSRKHVPFCLQELKRGRIWISKIDACVSRTLNVISNSTSSMDPSKSLLNYASVVQ